MLLAQLFPHYEASDARVYLFIFKNFTQHFF